MTHRPWTVAELAILRKYASQGVDVVAGMVGRTPKSVRETARRNAISLRRLGERRGKVIGEDRAGSLLEERMRHIRDDILSGEVSDEQIHAHQQAVIAAEMGQLQRLCPACTARPVAKMSTGLCRPCHLRTLAEGHRHSKTEKEATRELWNEKQRSKRRRDSGSPIDNEMGDPQCD